MFILENPLHHIYLFRYGCNRPYDKVCKRRSINITMHMHYLILCKAHCIIQIVYVVSYTALRAFPGDPAACSFRTRRCQLRIPRGPEALPPAPASAYAFAERLVRNGWSGFQTIRRSIQEMQMGDSRLRTLVCKMGQSNLFK